MPISETNRNLAVVSEAPVDDVHEPSKASSCTVDVVHSKLPLFAMLPIVKDGPVSLLGSPSDPGASSYCRCHLVISQDWYLSTLSSQATSGSAPSETSVAVRLTPVRLAKLQVRTPSVVVQFRSSFVVPIAMDLVLEVKSVSRLD
jgi:hypothetical protein